MRMWRVSCLLVLCAGCLAHAEPVPAGPEPEVVAIRTQPLTIPAVLPVFERALPLIEEVAGTTPPAPATLATTLGEATYYASYFDGRRTASGIVFRNSEAYAAHRTYPFGTVVRVTNTRNDRSVVVRVVDRGPHGTSERARRTIIDLSRSAAEQLDFVSAGRTPVRVEVLEWGAGR